MNTLIYGLDADLIMLSINHNNLGNLYLIREKPHFGPKTTPKMQNNKDSHNHNHNHKHNHKHNHNHKYEDKEHSEDDNELCLLDIILLTQKIVNELRSDFVLIRGENENIMNDIVKDYIFICFLLGNDFLPHFASLNIRTNGIDKIISAYSEVFCDIKYKNLTITKDGVIIWSNFYKLILNLSKKEEEFIINEYNLRNKNESRWFDTSTPEKKIEKFELLPTFERYEEKYINPIEKYWQERYYYILLNECSSSQISKQQICENYLEMLEWTFKYYNYSCNDWRISYKYSTAPLLEDLISYIPCFQKEFITKNRQHVSPIVQLIYVLPKESYHLLPTNIIEKIKDSTLYKDDNLNPEISWAFKKYFWESHINLSKIDINNIETILG